MREKMKKLIYAILICIIIAGIVVIATVGLKADIVYSKNVKIEIFLGKTFEMKDMKNIIEEVFPKERKLVQEIELFEDSVSITLADNRTEEELNTKVEELNTKINEKYDLDNKTEDITITHNPKVKLSSIIIPYISGLVISLIIILIYVSIRYKKLGVLNILLTYILSILGAEMLLLSIIAITRFQINRTVIPLGLLLLVVIITILGLLNEKKLSKVNEAESKENNK